LLLANSEQVIKVALMRETMKGGRVWPLQWLH